MARINPNDKGIKSSDKTIEILNEYFTQILSNTIIKIEINKPSWVNQWSLSISPPISDLTFLTWNGSIAYVEHHNPNKDYIHINCDWIPTQQLSLKDPKSCDKLKEAINSSLTQHILEVQRAKQIKKHKLLNIYD